MTSFGERLRELRDKAEMTQEALARAADVSTGTVSKLEEREGMDPSWSTVCKLADALGVSTEDFRSKEAKPAAGQRRRTKGKGRE
jgi:transcriptional regulator with XRE-family HTH domain